MTTILHVSGLGWSGSGAVIDHLLDTDRFFGLKGKPRSVSESRLFSGRPSIPDLVATIGPLSAEDVLALWTAGARVPSTARVSVPVHRFLRRTSASHAVNSKVFRTVGDDPLRAAAEEAATSVNGAGGADRTAAYIRATYAAMRSLLGSTGRPLLLDNDPGVTSRIAQHLAADPDVRFVAVVRDPSDQYVDKRAKVDRDASIVENLARTLVSARLRRRELIALREAASTWPSRALAVRFERFVHESSYRAALRDVLLPDLRTSATPVPEERFIPERSAQNIGLTPAHRDRVTVAAYRRVCRRAHQQVAVIAVPDHWEPPLA